MTFISENFLFPNHLSVLEFVRLRTCAYLKAYILFISETFEFVKQRNHEN